MQCCKSIHIQKLYLILYFNYCFGFKIVLTVNELFFSFSSKKKKWFLFWSMEKSNGLMTAESYLVGPKALEAQNEAQFNDAWQAQEPERAPQKHKP